MVFKGTPTNGLRDCQNIMLCNASATVEGDVLQINATIGEEHSAPIATILVMVFGFQALQNGIKVAIGAKRLLGAE